MSLLRRMVQPFLVWNRYQGFVARRYLLVRESKVSSLTWLGMLAALVALVAIAVFDGTHPSPTAAALERIVGACLVLVLVAGVVRFSKVATWALIVGGMIGAVGGMVFSKYVGQVLEQIGSYTPIFVVAASAYLLALLAVHVLTPKMEPVKI